MSVPVVCRSCGGSDLSLILSLGKTPLANALLTAQQLQQPEQTYPLDLALCPACSLAQITETIPPERLFREYPYFSSFSDTMLRHAQAIAQEAAAGKTLETVATSDFSFSGSSGQCSEIKSESDSSDSRLTGLTPWAAKVAAPA